MFTVRRWWLLLDVAKERTHAGCNTTIGLYLFIYNIERPRISMWMFVCNSECCWLQIYQAYFENVIEFCYLTYSNLFHYLREDGPIIILNRWYRTTRTWLNLSRINNPLVQNCVTFFLFVQGIRIIIFVCSQQRWKHRKT